MSIEIIPFCGFITLFLTVIFAIEFGTRKGKFPPESSRKMVHVGGGAGALLFPLFMSQWETVAALALCMGIFLFAGERLGWLTSLTNVGRKSAGAVLFPVAVLLIFAVSQDRLWLYVSSMLVLTLADTGAAMIGTRYGQVKYKTGKSEAKSVEGSFTFWLTAFLVIHLPLLLLSDIPKETTVVTALLMATLLTGVEAISTKGTDNILVPLASCFMLLKMTTKPSEELLFQLVSLLVIGAVIAVINRKKQMMHLRQQILLILITFTVWSLGTVQWVAPIVGAVVAYLLISEKRDPIVEDFSLRHLISTFSPSMIILFVANTVFNFSFWMGAFILVTSLSLSFYLAEHLRVRMISFRQIVTLAAVPILVSYGLILPFEPLAYLIVLPVSLLISSIFMAVFLALPRWNPDLIIPTLASLAGVVFLVIQLAGFVPELDQFTWKALFR